MQDEHRLPIYSLPAHWIHAAVSERTRKPGLTDREAPDPCAAAKQMVCAYLMSTEGLSVYAAVDSVRAKRRVICPNIGFMQQLRLWEEMGCKLDDSNPQYRSAAHSA